MFFVCLVFFSVLVLFLDRLVLVLGDIYIIKLMADHHIISLTTRKLRCLDLSMFVIFLHCIFNDMLENICSEVLFTC